MENKLIQGIIEKIKDQDEEAKSNDEEQGGWGTFIDFKFTGVDCLVEIEKSGKENNLFITLSQNPFPALSSESMVNELKRNIANKTDYSFDSLSIDLLKGEK